MPTFAHIRARVRERLVAVLGDQATDDDVRATCWNIYVAFMATLDLRPKHLSEAEVDELVESVDALWSEELELLAEAAKQTLAEGHRRGRSPAVTATELQRLIEREFLREGGNAS